MEHCSNTNWNYVQSKNMFLFFSKCPNLFESQPGMKALCQNKKFLFDARVCVCLCLTHTERWFCSRWSREGWVTAVNSSYSDSGGGSAFLTAPPVIPVMTRVFDNSSIWQWSHLSVYDGGKSTVMKSNTQRRWMMFLIERAASGTGGRVRPLLQSCSEQMMLVKRSNHWLLSMF